MRIEDQLINELCALPVGSFTDDHFRTIDLAIKRAAGRIFFSPDVRAAVQKLQAPALKAYLEKRPHQSDALLSLLTDSQLEQITSDASALFDLYKEMRERALESPYQIQKQALIAEALIVIRSFVYHIIELFIALTNINEAQDNGRRSSTNSFEATSKLRLYLEILGFPSLLFGVIYTKAKHKTPALLVTASLTAFAVSFVFIYIRFLKPCPTACRELENLSIQFLRENQSVYPRRELLRKIEKVFSERKGVILVGEQGSGKTELIRSLYKEMAKGRVCEFIKGFQLFGGNASSFIFMGSDNGLLNVFQQCFRGHEDNVVFFFDELHSLFQGSSVGTNQGVNALKTFASQFPYIISATTEEEYERHIKGATAIVGRRFQIIKVPKMEEDEVKAALLLRLEEQFHTAVLDEGAIDYLVEKASQYNNKTALIDAAQSLLSAVLMRLNEAVPPELEDSVAKAKEELKRLEQDVLFNLNRRSADAGKTEALQNKKRELEEKKALLDQRKKEAKELSFLEAEKTALEKRVFSLSEGERPSREWLECQVKIFALSQAILNKRQEINLPGSICRQLIDSVCSPA